MFPLPAFFAALARIRSNLCLGVSAFFVNGDAFGLSIEYLTILSSTFPLGVMNFSFSGFNFFVPYRSLDILSAYGLGKPLLVIHLYVGPSASILRLAAAV